MARRFEEEEDWGDEYDAEYDDADDYDEDDNEDAATISCPYCDQEIHEDSIRCPHCEHYISDENAPPKRKPWWIIIGFLLCFYVVYRWVFP